MSGHWSEPSFSDDVSADLQRGLLVEMAELYALDAFTREEERAVEAALAYASLAVQQEFRRRVMAARETLTTAFGNVRMAPSTSLWSRIVAVLQRRPLQ